MNIEWKQITEKEPQEGELIVWWKNSQMFGAGEYSYLQETPFDENGNFRGEDKKYKGEFKPFVFDWNSATAVNLKIGDYFYRFESPEVE